MMSAVCSLARRLPAILLAGTTSLLTALAPNQVPGLRHDTPFFPEARLRASMPSPEAILGFPLAERAATTEQVTACIVAWTTAAPDRTRLVEYARSHAGHPLHYVIVSAPENLARLEAIEADLARLGDPRSLEPAEVEALIRELPAVAWLAYTLHGDETEGSDAALALLHHLIDSDDDQAAAFRRHLLIIIDPLMNPDGRSRFLKMVAEHRGQMPNFDDQSLIHSGYWPRGRGNHYLFDLNRDQILGVHPETRGRLREIARWNPVLLVDAHGMGAQDTHLFSPPREPVNPNMPASRAVWLDRFAADQARAFDQHQLVYYTGEWHEEWYPGYTDAYASYRGAIGILYEQARIAEDAVRRPGGRLLSYRESVHHHVIGSMANLLTTLVHREELLRNLWETRREALDSTGPYAQRTFAILPTPNRSRFEAFADLMRLQGFELHETTRTTAITDATDLLGRQHATVELPAGTLLLPNRQPLGHLLAAMLEFDPRFSPAVLADERKELLLRGRSRIYDTTAWNLALFYGLTAYQLPVDLPPASRPLPSPAPAKTSLVNDPNRALAFVFNGDDDASVTAAARLLERGVEVRLAEKPFHLASHAFPRGSVVVTRLDNRHLDHDLPQTVSAVAMETGLPAVGIDAGLGAGDLPDLGGRHFRRLEPPRIALVGREDSSPTDFGATWHLLDHQLAIRHSHLAGLAGRDLQRYNVILLPEGRHPLPDALKEWVRAGGTLIAVGSAITGLLPENAGWSRVRALPDVLGRLDDYELTLFREWLGAQAQLPDLSQIWSHQPLPKLDYPWQSLGGDRPPEKELKRRDDWQTLFMPQGAFLAARVNPEHWLTAGCGDWLPVMVGRHPVLMADSAVEAPVRYGFLEAMHNAQTNPGPNPAPAASPDESPADTPPSPGRDRQSPGRVGWAATPPDTHLHLRLSGLLWPEAAHRLAHAAWCTRESYGRGQIILFATPPAFRGTARATARVYLNAIVYGPGLGASQPIRP